MGEVREGLSDWQCAQCHSPSMDINYDGLCPDCMDLAASPYRLRDCRTHVFIAGSGGWCFRCGVKRDDTVHMPGVTGQAPTTVNGVW